MKKLSKEAIIGYPAGIITGIAYGLNPLFGMPLINNGAAIESILFFRYAFAVVILGLFLWLSKQSFKISFKQAGVLIVLGLFYTASSLFLFEAYNYIASGLATHSYSYIPYWWLLLWSFWALFPHGRYGLP